MLELALELFLARCGDTQFGHISERADAARGITFVVEYHVQLEVDPFDRAVTTSNPKLYGRRREALLVSCYRGFDDRPIVRVNKSEHFLPGRRRRTRNYPEYPVGFFRPDDLVRTEIALEASYPGDTLGARQMLLAAAEFFGAPFERLMCGPNLAGPFMNATL